MTTLYLISFGYLFKNKTRIWRWVSDPLLCSRRTRTCWIGFKSELWLLLSGCSQICPQHTPALSWLFAKDHSLVGRWTLAQSEDLSALDWVYYDVYPAGVSTWPPCHEARMVQLTFWNTLLYLWSSVTLTIRFLWKYETTLPTEFWCGPWWPPANKLSRTWLLSRVLLMYVADYQ